MTISVFHSSPDLPLAAGFDLLGIVVFLIVAGVSAFLKKVEQTPTGNRSIPFPPRSPSPKEPPPLHENERSPEIRGFLGEAEERKQLQKPPLLPKQPASRPSTRAVPRPVMRTVRRVPAPIATPLTDSSPSMAGEGAASYDPMQQKSTNIQEEIAQSMSDARLGVSSERISISTARPNENPTAAMGWNLEALRAPLRLKEAILLREVLGPPRAFDPL